MGQREKHFIFKPSSIRNLKKCIFYQGKYTFKDGRTYEGYFEDDKMTDSPTYNRASILSHEISKIKTRIPSGIH